MGRYDEERKKLGISTTTTKSQTTKVNTSSRYDNERKKLYEEPKKQSALAAMRAPATLPQNSTQKMVNLMASPMPKNLMPSKTADKKENTLPYVKTYEEVPKNFSSGNILGGVGNTLKGTGQMVLEGLQGPQKLVLNASKAIIDTTKGKKPSFDTNISTESYLKDTGNADTEKFYKTTGGKIASTALGVVSDPLTWVGGGLASDVAKARRVGTAGLLNNAKIGEKVGTKALKEELDTAEYMKSLTKKDFKTELNDISHPDHKLAVNELKDYDTEISDIKSKLSDKTANLKPVNDVLSQPNKSGVITPNLSKELPNTANKNISVNIDNGSSMLNVPVNKQAKNVASKLDNGLPISKVKTNTLAKTDMLTQVEKNMLDDKDFTHDIKSETESIGEAQKRLAKNYDGEVKTLNAKETYSGSDVDAMFGVVENELKTARETGSYDKVKSMLKNTRKAGTEGGRTVQAFYKYSRTTEGELVKAQRVVDAVEDEIKKTNPKKIKAIEDETKRRIKERTDLGKVTDPEEIRDIVKKEYGVPTLTDEDIKFITDGMEKAKGFADGSYNKKMWETKVQQRIADKIPASGYEKFRGLQRISLILNPKSLITRNPLGNVILGTAETVKDVPGAMIDKVASFATKERTTALNPFNKLKGQTQGFKQGVREFGKDIKNNVDTSPTRGQLELPSGRVFKNKTLNAIDQFERKALQLGDRPFYQAAYTGRLAELKGLGRTVDETTQAEAKLYALDRVFQGNSVLSKKAKQLKESLGIIGDIAMPFTQTPANVMDKLIDYTPGGLMKAVSQIGTIGKGTFNQKLFVDRLGRSLTGTVIGILGYVMAQKGLITGQRNADKDVANFEQSLGKNPYAVKLGDNYYAFDWAQPISGLLAAGADAYQAGKDKKDFISSLGAGATAAGNTMINQSFLQGVVSLMSGYSPVAGLTKTALSAPLQAAPTFTSNIAKQIDPNVRETYDPNLLKQTANKFVAKVPFASKTLPKKIDQSGNEILQQQGAGTLQKGFNLFINPGVSTTFKPDATQKEILRLYNEGGTKIQVPTAVEKYISETKDHPRINLTADEFTQYQKRTGQLTINGGNVVGSTLPFVGFKTAMNQDRYKNAKATKDKTVDEVRADILADVISKAKAQAKKEILKSRGYEK